MIDMLNAYHLSQVPNKRNDTLHSLSANINLLAKKSNLVQRQSKTFNPEAFLLALIECVNTGKGSLTHIAIAYSKQANGAILTPQAIHERINRHADSLESFLVSCISHCISQKFRSSSTSSSLSKNNFNRILVEDSSFVKLRKSCADLFKAHGNRHGKTAGMKLNLIFDLLTGDPVDAALHNGYTPDQRIGWDILELVQDQDLVLRDMGYFDIELFKAIEEKGAYWLSRLTAASTVEINKMDSKTGAILKTQSLDELLQKTTLNKVDVTAHVTRSGHKCRLVAYRASKTEAEKRRREAYASSKKRGKTPSKRSLLRAEWHIMITNIEEDVIDAKTLTKIYQQRWSIEILFRGWKQSSAMNGSLRRKSSRQHLVAFLLTSILILLLTMKLAARIREKYSDNLLSSLLSFEKLASWFSLQLPSIVRLVDITRFSPEVKYVNTQKKKVKTQYQKLLELLV